MELIREYKTGRLVTRVYRHDAVRDMASAISFLIAAAGLERFHPQYISLRDLEHSPDEGNGSRQFPPDVSAEEIQKALAVNPRAKLYLSGRFQRASAGVGIDMLSFELSLTMSAKQKERMEELAAMLSHGQKRL